MDRIIVLSTWLVFKQKFIHLNFYSRWGVLFSHPADFTPVCTTELGAVAALIPEFAKRNIKCIALSCDPVESHNNWIKDIQAYNKLPPDNFPYPIISDPQRDIAIKLGMLDPNEKDKAGLPLTARAVSGTSKSCVVSQISPVGLHCRARQETQVISLISCYHWT